MFHKGARVSGGNASPEVAKSINTMLDEFTPIVWKMVQEAKVRNAAVRSTLMCNLLIVLDSAHVFVGAQKANGMPSTQTADHPDKSLSIQDMYTACVWELGFDDPFVLEFDKQLLVLSTEQRVAALSAVANAHVQSELNRVQKLMNLIQINPIFGPAAYAVDQRLCFVLMPFKDDLTTIYNTIVKPAVQNPEFNLVCKRADDIKTNKAIIQDIFKSICEAKVIIADLTGFNANVMYELGVAHTLGKETVLIYQKTDVEVKFPFDLAHIRRIEYVDNAQGGKKLETELTDVLRTVLNPPVLVSR